ncbi:unnamed protein product [Auanema sp. JU1783]|nr:unnamed protein product [Auanema sp. JU1783]
MTDYSEGENDRRETVTTSENSSTTRNKMGFITCTSYIINNIIGSGIFITPTSILLYTNSIGLSLLVWAGCGLISILGAIVYIELGTSITDPGCDFAYTTYVGWEALAFAFMWVSCLVTYPASAAVQAQTFGQYLMGGLSPLFTLESFWNSVAERLIGLVLLIALTALNFFSIDKYAGRFQSVMSFAKVIIVFVIIGFGFAQLFQGHFENIQNPMAGSVYSPGKLSLAFYGGLWSYAGWDILNYGTPEIYKPRRTIPLSLITGIIAVTLIYVLINFSYFVVLSPEQVKNSTAVAADFAQACMGNGSYAIPFMIAILLIGTLNSNIFCGSRAMRAAAQKRHFPPFLSGTHEESDSPRSALLGQLICTVFVSFIDIDTLINYVTFVMWGQRAVTILALLYLRYKKMPVAENPIKVPLFAIVLFLIISIALVFVPFIEETLVTIIGVVFVFSGLILYFLLVKTPSSPKYIVSLNDSLSNFFNRLLNCQLVIDDGKVEHKNPEERPLQERIANS